MARRLKPNVLRIDYCDLKVQGSEEKDIYFAKAQELAFKAHGFPANPWNSAIQYKSAILDRDHFPAVSGFEATFWFDLAPGSGRSGLQAVVERPGLWKVAVNGKPVQARPNDWWLDTAFGVYDIGSAVTDGKNRLTLVARPMSVHNELEPVHILDPLVQFLL
ncbi:MAG: hypothetical protein M1541_17315, partial [Acidobacteria bacterium]|nr:hypothetical protein [Acidobacteriota bacterium]